MLEIASFMAIGLVVAFAVASRLDPLQKKKLKGGVNRFFEWMEDRGHLARMPSFDPGGYKDYPELRVLEEHWKEIAAECAVLMERRDVLVPMQKLGGGYTVSEIHAADWKTLMFKSGRFIEENCLLAPRTAELLASIPGADTAFFSVLEPGERIEPHWGYYKGFVRYHLGVLIPYNNVNGECFIRLNSDPDVKRTQARERIDEGVAYYWKNGEGVFFDDTHLHDAHNRSDRVRVVLFVDVRKKMPAPLRWLNQLFVFIAHSDSSVRRIRENARIRTS
ncbi:MAG: aspartyl/asparaginyl beta-hydroxylase domain-containing protein [Myxococcales bacterium]|nr:aspartyl/asparaginyl beta-hydroxylase domain-containing protein [Myxococcales bacterium]